MKSLSRDRLVATPWNATHQASPESQGWRSQVGCCLWGRTEADTTEATQQQQQHSSRPLLLCCVQHSGRTYTQVIIISPSEKPTVAEHPQRGVIEFKILPEVFFGRGMLLSSSTRERTCALCIESRVLTTEPPGKSLI